MFRSLNFLKMTVMAAATLVACLLITSAPAEARWRAHGARAAHFHHARIAHRPVYRPRFARRAYVARPYYRPRFYPAPVYSSWPAYGYRCVIRKRWVPGPFGWHVVRRRVCF